ncbi:hypothetical protein ES703_02204 [subsurface metagenome]
MKRKVGESRSNNVPSFAIFSSKQFLKKRKKMIRENEPIRGERSQGNRTNMEGVRNRECPC